MQNIPRYSDGDLQSTVATLVGYITNTKFLDQALQKLKLG